MTKKEEAIQRVFTRLKEMKPGEVLNIEKEAKGRPDLYIAICKEFIDSGYYNYEFNSKYTKIRRLLDFF